jgi:hypothetical protein
MRLFPRKGSSSFFEKKTPKKLLLRFARVFGRQRVAMTEWRLPPRCGAARLISLNRAAPLLRVKVFFAFLMLWTERLLQLAFWPFLVVAFYTAAALFGAANGWVWLTSCTAALALLVFGLWRFKTPTPHDVEARIEASSGLTHRPFAALTDQPVHDTPLGAALWHIHQARARQQLAGARAGGPAPDLETLDPFALRILLVLLLLTGLVAAGPGRLAGAFALPAWPFPGPAVTAWVTPPAYAGIAPYIAPPGTPITALTGAQVTVLISGPSHAPAIRLGPAKIPDLPLDAGNFRAALTLQQSGRLTIGPWWHRLARWQITVQPPAAPVLTITNVRVDRDILTFTWKISDPYGLDHLSATLLPAAYQHALPATLTLPAQPTGSAYADLHHVPFYLLDTHLTLTATNIAGATAQAAPFTVFEPLPVPPNRTVLSLMLLRERLALHPDDLPGAGQAVLALAKAPLTTISAPADLHLAYTGAAMQSRAINPVQAETRLLEVQEEVTPAPNAAAQALAAAAGQALAKIMQAEATLRDATGQGNATPDDQASIAGQLAALQQGMAHAGVPAPTLAAAQNAMQQAETNLAAQNFQAAGHAEAQAIQALQKTAAGLAQSGAGDSGPLPGLNPAPVNPADAVEQEIMRRDAEPALPAMVHEYLRRLLNLEGK